MANQFTPCQAKYNDDNNDDDVYELNNDGVEVQFNNSKDTNNTAEASEETCWRSMATILMMVVMFQGDQIWVSSSE